MKLYSKEFKKYICKLCYYDISKTKHICCAYNDRVVIGNYNDMFSFIMARKRRYINLLWFEWQKKERGEKCVLDPCLDVQNMTVQLKLEI